MRFSFIAIPIAALLLVACNSPGTPDPGTGPENTLIETPEYSGVIFSEDGASEFGPILGTDPPAFWKPSIDDVTSAETCIRQFLASAQDNPNLEAYQKNNSAFILENLKKYRRQYVGIVVDGEKRIWCNLFLSDDSFPNWQSAPVYALDGGTDYWEIEYIPLKDECINFYVHGEA